MCPTDFFPPFFNFQYILIHVRKQKLLDGTKSHPLPVPCYVLSSPKADTENFGVTDVQQGSTPAKEGRGMENRQGGWIGLTANQAPQSQPAW